MRLVVNKLANTFNFYWQKLVQLVNNTLDNIGKTIDGILSKIPKSIEDAYTILVQNLTAKNAIILALVYILLTNIKFFLGNVWYLAVILAAIAIIEGSLRLR